MDAIKAIYERRAIRHYADREVPRADLLKLIDAAIQAPSAMNQQPWAFAIFADRTILKNYSDRAKAHLRSTLGSGHGLPDDLGRMLADADYNIFYNAGILVVICARPGGLNPAEDCCLAAQNLMLAAHAMGLGTCPIGFARPWLNRPDVKKELGIPADYAAVFPVIIGWPAETPAPVPRKEVQLLT